MAFLDTSHFEEMEQLAGQQAGQSEAFLAEKQAGSGSTAEGEGLCYCRIASLTRFDVRDENYWRSMVAFYSTVAKLETTVVFLWQAHAQNLLTLDVGFEPSLAQELSRALAEQIRGVTYTASESPPINPSFEVWGIDGLCCSGSKNIPSIDEALATLKEGAALMMVLTPISDVQITATSVRVDKHASYLSLFQKFSATSGITKSTTRTNGTADAKAQVQINTTMRSSTNSDTNARQAGSTRGSNAGVHSLLSAGSNTGSNQGASVSHSVGNTQGTTQGTTLGCTSTVSTTETVGNSTLSNQTTTATFSRVGNILQQLLHRKNRLNRARSAGMSRFAVYTLAKEKEACVTLAVLNAQAKGAETVGDVNDDVYSSIRPVGSACEMTRLIRTGRHPASFGTATLPCEIFPFLPTRELRGFPVQYTTSFARNIVHQPGAETIRIGAIVDEEKVTTRPATLNIDEFTSHILAVGSTGSGKTTAVTNLCNSVMALRPHLHVLVVDPKNSIQPADFLGGACLYSTRTDTNSNILRLNPFAVPPGVSLAGHIDRLTELFDSCWPLSAAMPDILKQAVFAAYRRCGWDVPRSLRLNVPGPQWPDFKLLEAETSRIIDEGGFSARTRSDYHGALCTRLHSLTTNACGEIFRSEDAIPFPALFDQSVVLHCGSLAAENLSLVMSILLMQLVEYRECTAKGTRNCGLRHLTIFDEAHALAPRSAPVSDDPESVSIGSKSSKTVVKLLAEARSLGEGIVLCNQTVHELSEQAVENTSTKLAFQLTGKGDIETVSAALALGLTPNNGVSQALGLARLEPYQALVYQRSWLSGPVKVKLDNNPLANNTPPVSPTMEDRRQWMGEVVQVLCSAPSLAVLQEQIQPLLADIRCNDQLRRDMCKRLEDCFSAEKDEERQATAGCLLLLIFDGLVGVLLPHSGGDPNLLFKGVIENLDSYADVSRLSPKAKEQLALEILRAEKERVTPGV